MNCLLLRGRQGVAYTSEAQDVRPFHGRENGFDSFIIHKQAPARRKYQAAHDIG
ncbi:MAG: hypothetical protein WBE88_05225 [Candidatus Acidiferrales bacterium]